MSSLRKMLTIPNANCINIECFSLNISESKFLELICEQDFIIMQHVHRDYRNMDYLSSDFIIKNKKSTCVVIFVDNCYMTYYHPDMTYLHYVGEDGNKIPINSPHPYHHKFIIDSYLSKKTVDECVKYMKTLTPIEDPSTSSISSTPTSCGTFDATLSNNLAELNRRHKEMIEEFSETNAHFISVSQYIADNYNKILLFYSFNHPTKHLFQHICGKIIDILSTYGVNNIKIDFNADPLAYYKGIVVESVKKNMLIDMNSYNPVFPDMKTQPYISDNNNLRNFIAHSYRVYKNIRLEKMQLSYKKTNLSLFSKTDT